MNQIQKNLVQIEDLLENNFNQQNPKLKTKLHKMNIADRRYLLSSEAMHMN